MKPLDGSTSVDICFRCGYCCRHYDVSYSSYLVEEARRFDVPVKGPCPHLVETDDGKTSCAIYFTGRPSFCSSGPSFENPLKDIEKKLDEGCEEFPACVKHIIDARRSQLMTILE